MSSLEKISADFKLLQELKTTHVYKAIHSLLVEWKDFEDHINVTRDSFDQCVNEFGSRERNLNSIEESVSESIKKLELLWKSIENRLKQAAHDENEFFKLIFEKQRKEFNLKQKRLISCQKSIQLREENLNAQQKLIEELHTKFDFEKKELEKIGKLAGKKFWAMKVKEKYIKIRVSKLDRKEQNVLKTMKEIKLKEKKIKERVASIKLKEEEIDSIIVSNEKRCKDLDFQEKKQNKFLKEFELKKKELLFRLQKKEKLLEERFKELDLKEKELEQNLKRFELKEKEIVSIKISSEERCKGLKFQEKQLKERYKAFEGIENQFCTFFNSLVKNDPSEDNHSYANIVG